MEIKHVDVEIISYHALFNKKISNQIPIKIVFSLTCAIATKFLVMKTAVMIGG
jgi:hypothetical protein